MAELAKSFRLMVGVPDYENYLRHMQQHHPDLTPMDAKTFIVTVSMRVTHRQAGI